MKYLFEQLPPDIAAQLHPDRKANEIAYWAAREELRAQYEGEWVGFADGRVVASGRIPVDVIHDGEQTGLYPFYICVGKEDQPCKIRRATIANDTNYPGQPL